MKNVCACHGVFTKDFPNIYSWWNLYWPWNCARREERNAARWLSRCLSTDLTEDPFTKGPLGEGPARSLFPPSSWHCWPDLETLCPLSSIVRQQSLCELMHHALEIRCVWASSKGCLKSDSSNAGHRQAQKLQAKAWHVVGLFVSQHKHKQLFICLLRPVSKPLCVCSLLRTCVAFLHQPLLGQSVVDTLHVAALGASVSVAATVSHLMGLPVSSSAIMTKYRPSPLVPDVSVRY